MHSARTTLTLCALAAGIAGASAAPASADSIAFIKDGNVRLMTPDGAKTVPVTTAGGYSTVSQADDGRMIALHGKRFHLLSRWGDVLADFTPVADGTAGSITLTGPFDPAISPDGTKIAYGFYVQYKSGDPNCGKPGGCMQGQLYTGTGYAKSDGPVEWSTPGFQPQYSWTDPSWIDNTRTLISSPTSAFVKEAAIDTAGDGKDALGWFSDDLVGNLSDGAMNRQETALAFIGNTEADRLRVYRTAGKPQEAAVPVGCLDAPVSAGGRWSSPTWAPDGERLAWAGPQGIYVAQLPGIGGACPDAAGIKVDAHQPGATSPSWGPADLPGPKPIPPTNPEVPNGPVGPTSPTSPNGPVDPVDLNKPGPTDTRAITSGKVTLKRALTRGIKVSVPCTGKGRVTVTATKGKRKLGTGKASCRNGSATVTVKLSAAGRNALRGAKRPKVTLSAAGATALSLTLR